MLISSRHAASFRTVHNHQVVLSVVQQAVSPGEQRNAESLSKLPCQIRLDNASIYFFLDQTFCLSAFAIIFTSHSTEMASVYKSLSKPDTPASKEDALSTGPKNRQRVLILSSRGITYRYALLHSTQPCAGQTNRSSTDRFITAIVTFSTTSTPFFPTAAKTQN